MTINKNEMEFYNNFNNLGALTIYYALHGLHKEPIENFLNFADLWSDDGYGGDKITPFYITQLAGLVNFVSDVIVKGAKTLIVSETYMQYLLRCFKDAYANRNIIGVLLAIKENATEEKSPLLTTIATQIVKLFDDNVLEVVENFFVSEDFIYCKEIMKKVASLETDTENNFSIKMRERVDDKIFAALRDSLVKKHIPLDTFAIIVEANENA